MEQSVTSATADVFERHFDAIKSGRLDAVMEDYASDAVILTPEQNFHGTNEILGFFQAFSAGFPPEVFPAVNTIHRDVQDDVIFVIWNAEPFIKRAADSFLIRDGKIQRHTILLIL
jgi:ketosteroid isomerase-like protein